MGIGTESTACVENPYPENNVPKRTRALRLGGFKEQEPFGSAGSMKGREKNRSPSARRDQRTGNPVGNETSRLSTLVTGHIPIYKPRPVTWE